MSMSKTREQFPLSRKKIYKKTLYGALGWAIILINGYAIAFLCLIGIGSGATKHVPIVTVSVFGLLLTVVILTFLYQKWYFEFYFYDLAHDYIIVKKNPITPKEIT